MKRTAILLLATVFLLSGAMLFSQEYRDYREYAERTGDLRIGADATVPTYFISLELSEFLGGPTIHYGLSDRLELKATIAPMVRVSSLLSTFADTETGGLVSFLAVGLVEAGARYYLSPYVNSWFIDGEVVAGFLAADYDFFNDDDSFLFMTAGSAFGVSLGYDFDGHFSVEAGAYLINPNLSIDVDNPFDMLIPIPKISATYLF